jgi:CheY-like chemotaxis protein
MDACVQPRRVLVVENEAIVRDLIVDVLIEDGFEVHAVANARDALSHLAAQWPVDVLFTDVELGGDVDGQRLAVLARKMLPELAVVYTSGSVERIEQVPDSVFVPKPYEPAKICTLLTKVTQQRGRRSYSVNPPLAKNVSSQWI